MKKMLTPISFIAIAIFIVVIAFPIVSLLNSTQDVLVTVSEKNAVIAMDGEQLAYGQTCIPQVKRGIHTFSASFGENTIADDFFVSANIVIIADEQKRNTGNDHAINNDSLQLVVETTSCAAWPWDIE